MQIQIDRSDKMDTIILIFLLLGSTPLSHPKTHIIAEPLSTTNYISQTEPEPLWNSAESTEPLWISDDEDELEQFLEFLF